MTDPERPQRKKRWWKRRRPTEPDRLHGQKIVTGDDLHEVFDDGGEVEYLPGYRRRLLHGVVLTILVALIITAVLLALAIARGDLKVPFFERETAQPFACPTDVVNFPANENINVSVYNSTDQGGLAADVAEQLRERGYNVQEIGNRSLSDNSSAAAIVSGPEGHANAYNLQQTIANTDYVEDERTDATVDIVLGRGFAGLVSPEDIDQSCGTLSCPRLIQSPSPTETATTTGAATPGASPSSDN